jgi:hypothetical protein
MHLRAASAEAHMDAGCAATYFSFRNGKFFATFSIYHAAKRDACGIFTMLRLIAKSVVNYRR